MVKSWIPGLTFVVKKGLIDNECIYLVAYLWFFNAKFFQQMISHMVFSCWICRYLNSSCLFFSCRIFYLKFIYSEKATKFSKIFTLLLSVCTVDKSKVEISQNFVAFSGYTNFTYIIPFIFEIVQKKSKFMLWDRNLYSSLQDN